MARKREQAQGDGLVARNAAKGIKAPRPKKEIAPLRPYQARAFLGRRSFWCRRRCGKRRSKKASAGCMRMLTS